MKLKTLWKIVGSWKNHLNERFSLPIDISGREVIVQIMPVEDKIDK